MFTLRIFVKLRKTQIPLALSKGFYFEKKTHNMYCIDLGVNDFLKDKTLCSYPYKPVIMDIVSTDDKKINDILETAIFQLAYERFKIRRIIQTSHESVDDMIEENKEFTVVKSKKDLKKKTINTNYNSKFKKFKKQ